MCNKKRGESVRGRADLSGRGGLGVGGLATAEKGQTGDSELQTKLGILRGGST